MPKNQIKRWSYSAYTQWQKCPAQYAYQRFEKLAPATTSPALERGTKIHALGEDYLNGHIQTVPNQYSTFEGMMMRARECGYMAEENWAVDCNWEPCEWNDWSRNWGMAKTDAHFFFDDENTLSIIDFKTGRVYPDHLKQAEVYAVFGSCYYPEAEKVEVEFWYLDQKTTPLGDSPFDFTLDEVMVAKEVWQGRIDRMMSSSLFLPKPSKMACRFCDFRSDKELSDGSPGPCEEWQDVE